MTLCGSNGACTAGAKKKRDLLLAIQPENSTDLVSRKVSKLSKRVFVNIAQNQLGQYVQGQFPPDIPDPAYGTPAALIISGVNNGIQPNVVVERQLGVESFAIGSAGICGCTVVTVVSDQAVYMVSSASLYIRSCPSFAYYFGDC